LKVAESNCICDGGQLEINAVRGGPVLFDEIHEHFTHVRISRNDNQGVSIVFADGHFGRGERKCPAVSAPPKLCVGSERAEKERGGEGRKLTPDFGRRRATTAREEQLHTSHKQVSVAKLDNGTYLPGPAARIKAAKTQVFLISVL
jgi:hypothetical protein